MLSYNREVMLIVANINEAFNKGVLCSTISTKQYLFEFVCQSAVYWGMGYDG